MAISSNPPPPVVSKPVERAAPVKVKVEQKVEQVKPEPKATAVNKSAVDNAKSKIDISV